MKIANFEIGKNKTFIIAELSANHNQDFDIAIKTIKAMKASGADAVKLQTYTADTITLDCDNKYFQIKHDTIWDGNTLHKLYQQAYTPWDWQPKLKEYAESLGLICFSSPFDKSAVDFLEQMKVPAYKIASFEITDIQLIEYSASKGKPMIISTGIAKEEDIQLAIDTCHSVGNKDIILLKTTSQYPAKIEDANLTMIPDLARRFNVIVGLSDHTLGVVVPIVATALGAKVMEKHFILDKSVGGPDASFSLDEKEFTVMVKAIRNVEKAVGKVDYSLSKKAEISRQFARSLYVVKDIEAGELITEENVRSIRPGNGLHPKYLKDVLKKRTLIELKAGMPLSFDVLS